MVEIVRGLETRLSKGLFRVVIGSTKVLGSNPVGTAMGVAIWRITGRTVYTVLVQRHTNTAP